MKHCTMKLVSILFAAIVLLGGSLFLMGGTAQAASMHTTPVSHQQMQQVPFCCNDIQVFVYATNVNVHADQFGQCPTPSTACQVSEQVSRTTVTAECQMRGQTVTDLGVTNNWWSLIIPPSGNDGWISNIYIQGGQTIAGEDFCPPGF